MFRFLKATMAPIVNMKHYSNTPNPVNFPKSKLTPLEQLAMLEHRNRKPDDPHADYLRWTREELIDEVIRLRLRVKDLEDQNFLMSWQISPESMGR